MAGIRVAEMQGETAWVKELVRVTRPCLLAAGMIAACGWTAAAMAQGGDGQVGSAADAAVQASVLKSLATAPELASEAITANTVGGVVTLSGSVSTERARTKAENVAANTAGVRKVVDELQLGSAQQASAGGAPMNQPPAGSVLLSDGTYGPANAGNDGQTIAQGNNPTPGSAPATQAQRNNPDADQALDQQTEQQNNPQYANGQAPNGQAPNGQAPNGQGQPNYPQQYPQQQPNYPQQQGYPQQQPTYPQQQPAYPQANGGYPQTNGGYPQANNNYPPRGPYGYPPQQQGGYPQQQYPQQQGGYQAQPNGQPRQVWGGQQPGEVVTVPSGAMIRVRVNRLLASNRTQPGTTFDGIVLNDVTADGFVAIPRGAAVQGTVVDAKASGALSGRGELTIQLTQVTLGGKVYPIVSDLWAHNGGDKTIETINKTAGFGALGAVIGAVGGGGVGAAIGGGVGAAAGVASSATSGRGQVIIPSEGVVVFHLAQAATVKTVSEQEMERLAYGVAPGADPRLQRRYPAGPGYYPYGGPGYGPGPYGYPNQ